MQKHQRMLQSQTAFRKLKSWGKFLLHGSCTWDLALRALERMLLERHKPIGIKELHRSQQTPNHHSPCKNQELKTRLNSFSIRAITDQIHTFSGSWCFEFTFIPQLLLWKWWKPPKCNSGINPDLCSTPTRHILKPAWWEREATLSFLLS